MNFCCITISIRLDYGLVSYFLSEGSMDNFPSQRSGRHCWLLRVLRVQVSLNIPAALGPRRILHEERIQCPVYNQPHSITRLLITEILVVNQIITKFLFHYYTIIPSSESFITNSSFLSLFLLWPCSVQVLFVLLCHTPRISASQLCECRHD